MSAPSRRSSSPSRRRPTPPATSSCSLAPLLSHQQRQQRQGDRRRYWGPDGSDNTIEAEIVIVTTFIYDNTRLLLLSKTEVPNGPPIRAASQRHVMAHMMVNGPVCFDDRHERSWGRARRSTRSTTSMPTTSTTEVGFIRGSQIRSEPATRRAVRSRSPPWPRRSACRAAGVSRLPREILLPPCRRGGADGEPALCRPDHRPRPERARRLGLPAPRDLRLAASQ